MKSIFIASKDFIFSSAQNLLGFMQSFVTIVVVYKNCISFLENTMLAKFKTLTSFIFL